MEFSKKRSKENIPKVSKGVEEGEVHMQRTRNQNGLGLLQQNTGY